MRDRNRIPEIIRRHGDESKIRIADLEEFRAKVDRSRCVELTSLKQLVERYDEIIGGAQ